MGAVLVLFGAIWLLPGIHHVLPRQLHDRTDSLGDLWWDRGRRWSIDRGQPEKTGRAVTAPAWRRRVLLPYLSARFMLEPIVGSRQDGAALGPDDLS